MAPVEERNLRRDTSSVAAATMDGEHDPQRQRPAVPRLLVAGEGHHHQEAPVLRQFQELVRLAPQDQHVALLQPHGGQLLPDPALLAPQADHDDAQRAPEVDLADRAADELRVRRHQRLHELVLAAELVLAVAVLGDGVQRQAGFVLDRGNLVGRRPDQQDVVGAAACPRAMRARGRRAWPQPFDHLQAVLEVRLELLSVLSIQGESASMTSSM